MRDELVAADVQWLADVARHQRQRAGHAVVDVHEAARLFAVAPDLDAPAAGAQASMTLRQRAAGAFSRPPSKVPCGPYTL